MPPYITLPTLEEWQTDSTDPNRINALYAAFDQKTASRLVKASMSPPTLQPRPGNVPKPKMAKPPRPAYLSEVDKLVRLYERSYNPMSRRNVLFDLKTELDKTKPASLWVGEALKALRDVTTRELANMPTAG